MFPSFLHVYGLLKVTSLVAQTVKHLPTTWETRVRSLGREDPLEKEMATHSSILAWEIPWTEEPGRIQSMGLQEWDTNKGLNNTQELAPVGIKQYHSVLRA